MGIAGSVVASVPFIIVHSGIYLLVECTSKYFISFGRKVKNNLYIFLLIYVI